MVSPVNVLMSERFTVWPMSTEEPAHRISLTGYLQSGHLHLPPYLCVTSREAQGPVSAKPQGKGITLPYVVGCSGTACTVLSHQGSVLHSDLSCLQSHGNFRMVLDPGLLSRTTPVSLLLLAQRGPWCQGTVFPLHSSFVRPGLWDPWRSLPELCQHMDIIAWLVPGPL